MEKQTGISVDLFKEAASSMDLRVEIKVDTWHKIKVELAEGRIDALPLVGRSLERDKIYDFTFPYHTLHGAVFVRKGTSGINILEDLKTGEIIVMKGGLRRTSQSESRRKRRLSISYPKKNNFASIGSLLSLQAQSISNPEALSALQDAMGRNSH